MAYPTLQEIRELSEWQPSLGVLSVYLGFEAGDRGDAWRTELNNALDRLLDGAKESEHEKRVALRATVQRLRERYEEAGRRPPPRGEAGFVEVAEGRGQERWWQSGVPPLATSPALHSEQPLVAPLVELIDACRPHGVALVSAERVRLLRYACRSLEEIEEMELSITSRDWRERKAGKPRDPVQAQAVSSAGKDQYDQRLEHNRARFLEQSGRLAGQRLSERGLGDALGFGPAADVARFAAGLDSTSVELLPGGDQDLVSVPAGELIDPVAAACERLAAERRRELASRALEAARGGGRGAAGLQEVTEALGEGRVEQLLFDTAIGDPAETLVRGALAGGAEITPLRDGAAELLAPAEGVAAILRY